MTREGARRVTTNARARREGDGEDEGAGGRREMAEFELDAPGGRREPVDVGVAPGARAARLTGGFDEEDGGASRRQGGEAPLGRWPCSSSPASACCARACARSARKKNRATRGWGGRAR